MIRTIAIILLCLPATSGLAATVAERLTAERVSLEAEIAALDGSERAARLEVLATRFHAQGLFGAARELYDQTLEADPARVAARYLRAMAFVELGEAASAAEDFQHVFDVGALDAPRRALVGYRLGAALFSIGEHDDARARLIDALIDATERAAILVLLADIASAEADWERARGLLERALVEQPGAGEVAYKLALVHRQLGNEERARAWLERRNDVAPAVTDPWLLAVAEQSESPRLFLDVAEQSWQRGDHTDAIAAYERAAALAPDDAAIRLSLAVALATLGRDDRAREEVARALELDATDPRAWYLRARLDGRRGVPEQALEAVSRSLALATTERARALRANLLMRLHRFEEAELDYAALSHSRMDDAALRYWLALARLGGGRCSDALGDIDRAVQLQPNWGEARVVAIRAAAICGDVERREAAFRQARQLATLNQSVATRISLAFIESANGEVEVAERLLTTVPDHPDSVLLRAAIERAEAPSLPFALSSEFWIPPDVRDASTPIVGEDVDIR